MSLDLEKQLVFYGSYHHDPVNIGIHVVFVPVLMMTFWVMFTMTPAIPLPDILSTSYLPLNVTTVLTLAYSALYILMEPVAGGAFSVLMLGWAVYSNHLTSMYGWGAVRYSGAINVLSWLVQFIGHGRFEGRAPALLDNLFQALFLAPLFVWLEILFAFGYRQGLKTRLESAVKKELEKFNAQKSKKVNGHSNGAIKSG